MLSLCYPVSQGLYSPNYYNVNTVQIDFLQKKQESDYHCKSVYSWHAAAQLSDISKRVKKSIVAEISRPDDYMLAKA